MEQNQRNKDERRKKYREGVETIGDMRENERKKQRDSDIGKKVLCL